MSAKGIALLFVCLLIGFYLEMNWLVILIAIVLFLIMIGSIKRESPQTVAVPKGEDILYPVIYEDVGEPPYLYPEHMEIKVMPDYFGGTSMWEDAAHGISNIIKTGIKTVSPKKEKKKEEGK